MVKKILRIFFLALAAMVIVLVTYPRICRSIGMNRSLRNADIVQAMFEDGRSLLDVEARLGVPDGVETDSEGIHWVYRDCGGYSLFVSASSKTSPIADIGLMVP